MKKCISAADDLITELDKTEPQAEAEKILREEKCASCGKSPFMLHDKTRTCGCGFTWDKPPEKEKLDEWTECIRGEEGAEFHQNEKPHQNDE